MEDIGGGQDNVKKTTPEGTHFSGKETWPDYVFYFFSPLPLVNHAKKKDIVAGLCISCNTYVRASVLATSNLKRHLESYNKEEFEKFESNLEESESLGNLKPQTKISFALLSTQHKQLDNCLVSLIVIDNLPLYTIRRPGFWSFSLVNMSQLKI